MSKESVLKMLDDAAKDEALMKALQERGDEAEAVVALGKEKGYDFTVAELQTAMQNNNLFDEEVELSEEELEAVAGGGVDDWFRNDLPRIRVRARGW